MTKQLSTQDRCDILYIVDKFGMCKANLLDMSDDIQYRFISRQLELINLEQDESLKLQENLKALKASQLKYKDSLSSIALSTGVSDAAEVPPLIAITSISTCDSQYFEAGIVASISDPPQITVLILGLYDDEFNPIGKMASLQNFNEGISVLTAKGSFDAPLPEGKTVYAVGSCCYVTQNGMQVANVVSSVCSYPKCIQVKAPTISEEHMHDPNHKYVLICHNRDSEDCDYIYEDMNKNTKIPMEGSISLNENIDELFYDKNGKAINASFQIYVIGVDASDNRVPNINNFDIFKDPGTVISDNTFSWKFTIPCSNYPTPPYYNQAYYLIFRLTLPVKGKNVSAFITNMPPVTEAGKASQTVFEIPILQLFN